MTSSSYKDKYPKFNVCTSKEEFLKLDIDNLLLKHDFKKSLGLSGDVSYRVKKHFKITIVGDIITYYKDGIPGLTIRRHEYIQRNVKQPEDLCEQAYIQEGIREPKRLQP